VAGALLLPGLAQAALTVTGSGATSAGDVWTLAGPGPYSITGSTTTESIKVTATTPVAVTLNNADIDLSGFTPVPALSLYHIIHIRQTVTP
jgi:hypothetical protein